jgi:hypothetical protein
MPYSSPVRRLERERERRQEAFMNKTFYCKSCDTAFKTSSSFKRHEKARSCLSIVTSPTPETEIRPDTPQVSTEPIDGQIVETSIAPTLTQVDEDADWFSGDALEEAFDDKVPHYFDIDESSFVSDNYM